MSAELRRWRRDLAGRLAELGREAEYSDLADLVVDGDAAPRLAVVQLRLVERLRSEHPDAYARKLGVTVLPLHDELARDVRPSLWMLQGALFAVAALVPARRVAGIDRAVALHCE